MKNKEITSPCFCCVEKGCSECACSVCSGTKDVWWSSKLMESIARNSSDCDKFIERLWRENYNIDWNENAKGELVLAQKWRGFPIRVFTQEDWFEWVDTYHSKGVGWVYDNVK